MSIKHRWVQQRVRHKQEREQKPIRRKKRGITQRKETRNHYKENNQKSMPEYVPPPVKKKPL
jgi:hypothetical protein